jgi:hypothetical protein
MGLGEDVKEVLRDVGLGFTIHKFDGTSISGEFLDYTVNRQVTKPFIREFFLEIMLPYDTQAVAGDLISFDGDGRRFLIMNLTPEIFEGDITEFNAVLYKVNASGEVFRASGEMNSDYHTTETWQRVAGCEVLITERLFGTELDQFSIIGQVEVEANDLYISGNAGIRPMDRFQVNPPSGEVYKVEVVKRHQFDNVHVCTIVEDTRA